jgi:hypothetical protein
MLDILSKRETGCGQIVLSPGNGLGRALCPGGARAVRPNYPLVRLGRATSADNARARDLSGAACCCAATTSCSTPSLKMSGQGEDILGTALGQVC